MPFSYVPARNAPIRSSNEISRSRSPIQGDGDEESHRMSASLVGLKISVRLRRLRSTSPPPPAGQWSGSERVKRAYVPRRRTSLLPIQPLTALHRTPDATAVEADPGRPGSIRAGACRALVGRPCQPARPPETARRRRAPDRRSPGQLAWGFVPGIIDRVRIGSHVQAPRCRTVRASGRRRRSDRPQPPRARTAEGSTPPLVRGRLQISLSKRR